MAVNSSFSSPVKFNSRDFQRAMECPICMEVVREPKVLPCAHTVCLVCLTRLLQQVTPDQPRLHRNPRLSAPSRKLRCPVCKKGHNVPSEGATGYPTNWQLQSILDLQKLKECGECGNLEVIHECGHCKVKVCVTCRKRHVTQHAELARESGETFKARLEESKTCSMESIDSARQRSMGDVVSRHKLLQDVIDARKEECLVSIKSHFDHMVVQLDESYLRNKSLSMIFEGNVDLYEEAAGSTVPQTETIQDLSGRIDELMGAFTGMSMSHREAEERILTEVDSDKDVIQRMFHIVQDAEPSQ